MVQKNVIIVAGGKGLRMKQSRPKQFLMLHGKPVIVHTIEAFLKFDPAIFITLVIGKSSWNIWNDIHKEYLPGIKVTLAEGGETRFQSVKSGLETVHSGLVAIHDAVRPLVSEDIIAASFKRAEETGSGIVMVPLKDSIRKKDGEFTRAEDRTHFFSVQTPQTFQVDLIKEAFAQEEVPTFTDDASVYEAAGMKVSLVIGDYKNLKITTPEDLLIAEALMK